MKKLLLIGAAVLIAVSANAQPKRFEKPTELNKPSVQAVQKMNRLDPDRTRFTHNKSGVAMPTAPKRIGDRDLYYNRPAGAFPCAYVADMTGNPLGWFIDDQQNYIGRWYYMKPYEYYTFKGHVYNYESLNNFWLAWESYEDPDEPVLYTDLGDEYPMYGVWGSEEDFPWFFGVVGPLDDPEDYYAFRGVTSFFDNDGKKTGDIPNTSECVPDHQEYGYNYIFWWAQKGFFPGGMFGDEPYTIRIISGLGMDGIDPNNNLADTTEDRIHGGCWTGKNSGVWETEDSVTWYNTLHIDGIAQIFEKPEHPYLLKSIGADFFFVELSAPVELTCKVYKLESVPAYGDRSVSLDREPGELVAIGKTVLRPEKIDTTDANAHFAKFELWAIDEEGEEYETGGMTIDYPFMVVIDGYNDIDEIIDMTAVVSRDIQSDEGFGETAYLLVEECDENLEFHGNYKWQGINNFFSTGTMKTAFGIYLEMTQPFLKTLIGDYFVEDTEYTFPNEGGEMHRSVYLFEDQTDPYEVDGVNFYSWIRANEGDWTVSCEATEDGEVPEWLTIELVDMGDENYVFQDGSKLRLGSMVNALVTAEPLPDDVRGREAVVRFEIPGEYRYYTFKQGEMRNPYDVNNDGEVSVADVNFLIDMILSGDKTPDGDVNGDGEVTISDINYLIDYILSH